MNELTHTAGKEVAMILEVHVSSIQEDLYKNFLSTCPKREYDCKVCLTAVTQLRGQSALQNMMDGRARRFSHRMADHDAAL